MTRDDEIRDALMIATCEVDAWTWPDEMDADDLERRGLVVTGRDHADEGFCHPTKAGEALVHDALASLATVGPSSDGGEREALRAGADAPDLELAAIAVRELAGEKLSRSHSDATIEKTDELFMLADRLSEAINAPDAASSPPAGGEEIDASVREPIAFEMTERGFKHYAPITTGYGHVVSVYESSEAEESCLWLAIDAGPSGLRDAGRLAAHLKPDQIDVLVKTLITAGDGHYQNRSGGEGDAPSPASSLEAAVLRHQRDKARAEIDRLIEAHKREVAGLLEQVPPASSDTREEEWRLLGAADVFARGGDPAVLRRLILDGDEERFGPLRLQRSTVIRTPWVDVPGEEEDR